MLPLHQKKYPKIHKFTYFESVFYCNLPNQTWLVAKYSKCSYKIHKNYFNLCVPIPVYYPKQIKINKKRGEDNYSLFQSYFVL